ncbi:MAG: protein phosphatase 2C domain-containing protein [Bacteriovorax sp.]|nr:protein phosphatase 2C domain-containing protein [Bacteriovorax sp.]
MIILVEYQFSGGSIIGTKHRQTNTNNQDSYFIEVQDDISVVLVSDGCSGCRFSEVGSKIGVRLVANSILSQTKRWLRFGNNLSHPSFWKHVKNDVLAYIRTLSNQMGESVFDIVNSYFLFTIIGAVVSSNETIFFSLGDGVVIINGGVYQIGPFKNNAPPYLAYPLLDVTFSDEEPNFLDFNIVEKIPTEEMKSFLIGTDGVNDLMVSADLTLAGKSDLVGPVSQFWEEDFYFKNPEGINRRLNLINRDFVHIEKDGSKFIERGRLPDDTTLVVGRVTEKEVS